MKNLIERFNSINSLKTNLEKEIEDTDDLIKDYSNMLGEKIRINEELASDDPDFIALKAKLDGDSGTKNKSDDKKSKDNKSDDKKSKSKVEKKKKGKKGVSDKWYNLNEILVYNGMGIKGELELYFKAVDELKAKLENLQRMQILLKNYLQCGQIPNPWYTL